MKVLYVSEIDLDGISGQNIATKEVISALSRNKNVELSLICPYPTNIHRSEILNSIDKKMFLPIRKAKSVRWHFLQQVSMVKNLTKMINMENPDLIISRLGASTFVTPIITSFKKRKYVLLIRGLTDFKKANKLPGSNLLGKMVYRLNASKAYDIYVAYEEIKKRVDIYRDNNQNPSVVLPNAVDLLKFHPEDLHISRLDINLGYSDKDFVIGFAGSIKKRHCLEELITSVSYYNERNNTDVKILIVGDGPELMNLKKLSTEINMLNNVVFTGFVDHNRVGTYINACNVMYGVIHPVHVENPIKCYEYLACGKPIITSNKKEMEFVGQNNFGYLTENLTNEELSRAINWVYHLNEKEFLEISDASSRYIINNYTWDKFVSTIIGEN